MSEENKMKLGYVPEINYEEEYYSDSSTDQETRIKVPAESSMHGHIQNTLQSIDVYLSLIPEDIESVIKETYDIAKEVWIKDLEDSEYGDIVYNHTEYKKKESIDEDSDEDIGEDSFWDDDSGFDLIEHRYDEESVIRQEYIKNMTDLLNFYFDGLKDALSKYLIGYITATQGKDKRDIAFIITQLLKFGKLNVKKGNEHLIDIGLRQEISTGLKLDFFSNTCSVDQSIARFNNFKAITEMRKKYARESYIDNYKRSSMMNDAMLQASKNLYSHKYDRNYAELYRYLNGSLSMTSDVLNDGLRAIKAKQTIIEKGGVIID